MILTNTCAFTTNTKDNKGDLSELSNPNPSWIKTIKCKPYAIVFEKTDALEIEYYITDKNGTKVGVLRRYEGFKFLPSNL